MGPTDILLHCLSLLAPALFVALVLPAAARLLLRPLAGRAGFWQQALPVFAASGAMQVMGLWWFGHDGKMATYAALVAAAASAQWLILRAWR